MNRYNEHSKKKMCWCGGHNAHNHKKHKTHNSTKRKLEIRAERRFKLEMKCGCSV